MRSVVALAFAAAFLPANPDPRVGTWTLVSAQSVLSPSNKLIITPVPNGVHLVMSGETSLDFAARSDGHSTVVAGNPAFNGIELHKISKKASEVKELKDGSQVATVREEVSKDGRELTTTTAVPGRPNTITLWDRTGGVTTPGNPFVGEWTQDMSKTRMREKLVLTIVPDGDGTRFTGDYSYTARFDGKPYDLKNSRNDTVQLKLSDARTVEAEYRRDNQVTQTDRWITSLDGRSLTVTSKGSSENGQHFSETLTFQKQ